MARDGREGYALPENFREGRVSETNQTPRRRRWPWIVLAGLLIVVGTPLAWMYRPLNGSERRLAGSWRTDRASLELGANRRFQYIALPGAPPMVGTWSASGDHLILARPRRRQSLMDFLEEIDDSIRGKRPSSQIDAYVEIESSNAFLMKGGSLTIGPRNWKRVSPGSQVPH